MAEHNDPAREPTSISMENLSRLSVDESNNLYWDGKRLVTAQQIFLTRGQVGAGVVIAIATFCQGLLAAVDLGCRFGWWISVCKQ